MKITLCRKKEYLTACSTEPFNLYKL